MRITEAANATEREEPDRTPHEQIDRQIVRERERETEHNRRINKK